MGALVVEERRCVEAKPGAIGWGQWALFVTRGVGAVGDEQGHVARSQGGRYC